MKIPRIILTILPFALIAVLGSSCSRVEDKTPRTLLITQGSTPSNGVVVSILAGDESLESNADASGIASFGTGTWDELGEFVSIKVSRYGEVVFDNVRKAESDNRMEIEIGSTEATEAPN